MCPWDIESRAGEVKVMFQPRWSSFFCETQQETSDQINKRLFSDNKGSFESMDSFFIQNK